MVVRSSPSKEAIHPIIPKSNKSAIGRRQGRLRITRALECSRRFQVRTYQGKFFREHRLRRFLFIESEWCGWATEGLAAFYPCAWIVVGGDVQQVEGWIAVAIRDPKVSVVRRIKLRRQTHFLG